MHGKEEHRDNDQWGAVPQRTCDKLSDETIFESNLT
jgi:hypothetical protein